MKSTRLVLFGASCSIGFCQIFFFFFWGGTLLTRPTPGVGNTHADNSLTGSKGRVQRLTLQTFSSRVER